MNSNIENLLLRHVRDLEQKQVIWPQDLRKVVTSLLRRMEKLDDEDQPDLDADSDLYVHHLLNALFVSSNHVHAWDWEREIPKLFKPEAVNLVLDEFSPVLLPLAWKIALIGAEHTEGDEEKPLYQANQAEILLRLEGRSDRLGAAIKAASAALKDFRETQDMDARDAINLLLHILGEVLNRNEGYDAGALEWVPALIRRLESLMPKQDLAWVERATYLWELITDKEKALVQLKRDVFRWKEQPDKLFVPFATLIHLPCRDRDEKFVREVINAGFYPVLIGQGIFYAVVWVVESLICLGAPDALDRLRDFLKEAKSDQDVYTHVRLLLHAAMRHGCEDCTVLLLDYMDSRLHSMSRKDREMFWLMGWNAVLTTPGIRKRVPARLAHPPREAMTEAQIDAWNVVESLVTDLMVTGVEPRVVMDAFRMAVKAKPHFRLVKGVENLLWQVIQSFTPLKSTDLPKDLADWAGGEDNSPVTVAAVAWLNHEYPETFRLLIKAFYKTRDDSERLQLLPALALVRRYSGQDEVARLIESIKDSGLVTDKLKRHHLLAYLLLDLYATNSRKKTLAVLGDTQDAMVSTVEGRLKLEAHELAYELIQQTVEMSGEYYIDGAMDMAGKMVDKIPRQEWNRLALAYFRVVLEPGPFVFQEAVDAAGLLIHKMEQPGVDRDLLQGMKKRLDWVRKARMEYDKAGSYEGPFAGSMDCVPLWLWMIHMDKTVSLNPEKLEKWMHQFLYISHLRQDNMPMMIARVLDIYPFMSLDSMLKFTLVVARRIVETSEHRVEHLESWTAGVLRPLKEKSAINIAYKSADEALWQFIEQIGSQKTWQENLPGAMAKKSHKRKKTKKRK